MKILLVEDEKKVADFVQKGLEEQGFMVEAAYDGDEGFLLASENSYDAIVLDIMLPGMSGFDVLEQIRVSHPTLPVIMVTARGSEEDRVNGLRSGADDYVVKPFSAKELLARVEAVLRRSPERPTDVHTIRADGLMVDLARREITMPDGSVHIIGSLDTYVYRLVFPARNPIGSWEIKLPAMGSVQRAR